MSESSGLARVKLLDHSAYASKAAGAILATHHAEWADILMWLHAHRGQAFTREAMDYSRLLEDRRLSSTAEQTTTPPDAAEATEQPAVPGRRAVPRGSAVEIDGYLLGSDRMAYPGSTPATQVPAFEPTTGHKPTGDAMHANGILVGPDREASAHGAQVNEAQEMANAFSLRTRAVHNASEGMVADTAETIGDKLGTGEEPAIRTMAAAMMGALCARKEMTFIGHSQGALQVCRAIEITIENLRETTTEDQFAAVLYAFIHVITIAGASLTYPDGPRYDHYINEDDDVPNKLGVDAWFAHGGKHAVYHRFRVTSTRKDEGGLPAGEDNFASAMTGAVNRSTHGATLYTDVIQGKPIEQEGGAKVVPIVDSRE